MNDLIDSLKALIHQQFDVDAATIDPDAPFADYNVDSLTLAELIFAIEDHYHVQVPDEAVGSVTNLRQLATLLHGLGATGTA